MGYTEDLQGAFKELLKIPEMVFPAVVKSVDKEEKTIVIEYEELEYTDVRLSASIDEATDKVILYPKINTSVLVGLIGNDENTLFVCDISEVESIAGTIGDCVFEIDTNGYYLTRKGINVKDLLMEGFINQNRLNGELQKVMVSVGVTPNIPKLNEIKTDNEQVINNIQKVFK